MRAFRLAYDGRPFYGFQRQPTVPTVEGALFDALRALSVLPPDADKPAGYAAAGRTDGGVSAVAQTVAFECPDWLMPRALNSELPATIRAWASADVPEDFHATHDAARREYIYHLYAPRATDTDDNSNSDSRTLDGRQRVADDRVAAAVDALAGRHDFHNLTPDDTGTKRDLTTGVERDGDVLVISVAAGGFARQLVRRVVAVVHAVGRGQQPIGWIDTLLDDKAVDPRPPAAPPEPLVMSRVVYPGVEFDRDPRAADSGASAFGERAVDALAGYRVSSALVDRLAPAEGEPEDKL
jgi:pseudouridylate synthase I